MDRDILRLLARKYFTYSKDEKIQRNRALHTAVNDLEMMRPVVLMDELPWHELSRYEELTLRCEDEYLRGVEWYLRRTIFQYENMPGDMIIPPYVPIRKIVHDTGDGIEVQEEILKTDDRNYIVSHEYFDQLSEDGDLDKLSLPVISYDEEETLRRYNLLGELIGDIVPIKIQGIGYFGTNPWDDISRYRGVTNLLVDLADRPEFSHKMVSILTDISLYRLKQYEELGLFDDDPISLHCTPILTNDLPAAPNGSDRLTRKNIWGRGTAQIFASVSKDMHDEFDIEYMKKTIGECGLSYYGCCEPLDKKIDIVSKLPNLRKISITPWADVDIATEAINKKYVLSSKPNPASVGVTTLDEDALKKEIGKILSACKRNNCACDIVLKDVSTCHNNPENLFRWERIVMDMVINY